MRSRSNTIGFRKIQFHRGNPESPANLEYLAARYNDVEREDDVENLDTEADKDLEEEPTNSSLEHTSVE